MKLTHPNIILKTALCACFLAVCANSQAYTPGTGSLSPYQAPADTRIDSVLSNISIVFIIPKDAVGVDVKEGEAENLVLMAYAKNDQPDTQSTVSDDTRSSQPASGIENASDMEVAQKNNVTSLDQSTSRPAQEFVSIDEQLKDPGVKEGNWLWAKKEHPELEFSQTDAVPATSDTPQAQAVTAEDSQDQPVDTADAEVGLETEDVLALEDSADDPEVGFGLDTANESLDTGFGSSGFTPIYPPGYNDVPTDEEKALGHATDRIIVKFKSEGEFALMADAHTLLESDEPFQYYVNSGSQSLDQLKQQFQFKRARALFGSSWRHGLKTDEAQWVQELARHSIMEEHEQRTARAPKNAELPDLTNIYLIEIPEGVDIKRVCSFLEQDPHIEYATPDYVVNQIAFPIDPPNDPLYAGNQYSLNNTGQTVQGQTGTADADIDAPEAWVNFQGDGVIVAVNDTGAVMNHPDLVGQFWVNPGETAGNGIDDDANGFIDDINGWDFGNDDNDPQDFNGHGTHVAGTIAAEGDNGIGVIGVAPQAQLMIVKGFADDDSGFTSDLVEGIEYAANNGASVINNSWGCSFACPSSPAVEDAVRTAHGMGVVVVFAAGNDNDDVVNWSPNNMTEPIVVAGSDNQDNRYSFSNFGSTVDVTAPAVSIASTYLTTSPNTGYAFSTGTSMAAPHVSGLAAILIQMSNTAGQGGNNVTIEQLIKLSTEDVGISNQGTGRINAFNALEGSLVLPVMSGGIDRSVETQSTLSFNVSASDPNGDDITLTATLFGGAALSTIGATFTDNGNGTGSFSWTPTDGQAGSDPTIVFRATDETTAFDEDSVDITVTARPTCGDGNVDVGEECDDGNNIDGDGCTAACIDEFCGDGTDNDGTNEECDDGNTDNGDGCSSTCELENCGDGVLDAGEECDDGNGVSGDGCSSACETEVCGNDRVDFGEECDDGNLVSGDGCTDMCVDEFCGDGVDNDGSNEECDDGNNISGDGCSATCLSEVCGNGRVDVGEECDDGNLVSGDGCTDMCVDEFCGDGTDNDGSNEECDDGNNTSGDGCSATCLSEVCGNGRVDAGEECDDGNTDALDGCNSVCVDEFCGDGIDNDGSLEECDDGNNISGDGCTSMCLDEYCGDGVVNDNGAEECDDGNDVSGDGCENCLIVSIRGDGICDWNAGETRYNTPEDCGARRGGSRSR